MYQEDTSGTVHLIQSRMSGLEYFAEHFAGGLLLLTNLGDPGSNLGLASAPLSHPSFRYVPKCPVPSLKLGKLWKNAGRMMEWRKRSTKWLLIPYRDGTLSCDVSF